MSKLFKVLITIYIGLAVFRLTDPSLWTKAQTPHPIASQIPSDIKIPTLNLDLAISPSVVKDNNWQVFDDRVAWLSTSALPGKGDTILYAHDTAGLFANLYKIKVGDAILLYTNSWLTYKVTEIHKVAPTDVSSILTTKNRLTIYTCAGSFDQKRLVVYAEP